MPNAVRKRQEIKSGDAEQKAIAHELTKKELFSTIFIGQRVELRGFQPNSHNNGVVVPTHNGRRGTIVRWEFDDSRTPAGMWVVQPDSSRHLGFGRGVV